LGLEKSDGKIAKADGFLSAPSVTYQSRSHGLAWVMEQLKVKRTCCASWNVAQRSSGQETTLLDCPPATASSDGARRAIGNYSSKDFVGANKGTHVAYCLWLRAGREGGNAIRTGC